METPEHCGEPMLPTGCEEARFNGVEEYQCRHCFHVEHVPLEKEAGAPP